MLLREYSIERRFAIPPLLTNICALRGQKRTPKIGSLQSRCIPKTTLDWFAISLTFLNRFNNFWQELARVFELSKTYLIVYVRLLLLS